VKDWEKYERIEKGVRKGMDWNGVEEERRGEDGLVFALKRESMKCL
jgi:hypothetical protein